MRHRDTMGRWFTPGIIGEIPTGNLLWVDAVNGMDALAVRGRATVPFKTLQAARDAAQSGDTIMVLPGTYNENDLLRDEVNWHFMNGAIVNYSGGGSYAIFDTHGVAVECRVTGHGEFRNTSASGAKQAVNFANSGAEVSIEGKAMYAQADCIKASAASGTLEVFVTEDITAVAECVWITGGCTVRVRAYLIETSLAAGLRMSDGLCEMEVDQLISYSTNSQDAAIRMDGGSGLSWVRAHEIKGFERPGVRYTAASSASKIHIHGARIVSAGTTSNGRSVEVISNVSDGVRLAACTLVATGDFSVFAQYSSTLVHVLNGAAANKAANGNVSAIGGSIVSNPNIN